MDNTSMSHCHKPNGYNDSQTQVRYREVLQFGWDHRIYGWWEHGEDLVRCGICTKIEFDEVASVAVDS